MTAPPPLTWFTDAETRPGIPDTVALTRRLMRWQRWCRERMTGQTPHAMILSGAAAGWSPTYSNPVSIGSFYVPAPPAPSRVLRVWWRKTNYASDGMIGLRSQRTGTTVWTEGEEVAYLVYTATLTIDAPDIVNIYAKWIDGAVYGVQAFSCWWEPLAPGGVTIDTAWSPLSQNFYAAGRSDAAYALRWLARKANQLTHERRRYVACGRTSTATKRIVLLPALVPSVKIWLYVKRATTTENVSAWVYDLGEIGTFAMPSVSVPGDNTWAWRSITLTCGFSAPRLVEFWFNGTDISNTSIAAVSIEEDPLTATDLALPSGETVPASFVDLDDPSILAGSPILADAMSGGSRGRGRKALVENMIWLWANKVRTIWWERFSGYSGQLGNTDPPSSQTMEIYRYRATPDGWAKQLRIATNGSALIGQWAADNGGAAVLQTLPEPNATGWFVQEAPAVAAGSPFIFRRIVLDPPGGSWGGLVVEELPMGTPTTSWP